jgi:hypothetical protein
MEITMIASRSVRLAVSAIPLLGGLLLSGCSVFQSSKEIDMEPFADNTATLFLEGAKIGRPFPWVSLRPYIEVPGFAEMRQRSITVLAGLKGIVRYSNQVVALNDAKLSDKEKNMHLVKYLQEATQKIGSGGMIDSIGIEKNPLIAIFSDIRNADTFLEGIRAASPLVHAVVITMGDQLEAIELGMPLITETIDRNIEAEFAKRKATYTNLTRLQAATLRGMGQLYSARRGDQAALDTLLREDPSVREVIPSAEKATSKGLTAAEALLTDRLMKLDTFIGQMAPEVASYKSKLQELEDWRMSVDLRVKIAREEISVWAQGHRNLGDGIPVPPMIDVTGFAADLAKKVSPVPIP